MNIELTIVEPIELVVGYSSPVTIGAALAGPKGDNGDDGDTFVTIGEYFYHAASNGLDTIGDWRQYADENGFYFQHCTVASDTKGGGTWVTKFTIQV